DQDVRFTSSGGSLCTDASCSQSAVNLPIRTDDLGNAYVTLVVNSSTAVTVTARSGTATGTLTLNTVNAELSAIVLNPESPTNLCLATPEFQTCGDHLCVVAKAERADQTGIAGLLLVFTAPNKQSDTGKDFTI